MQRTEHSYIVLTGRNSVIVESFVYTGVRIAALMLPKFTKEVLQQQALSLPSNCQPNYSKVIHTKQAKQRHIIRSRHTGPRSPTTVRNIQSPHTEESCEMMMGLQRKTEVCLLLATWYSLFPKQKQLLKAYINPL